jgi:hypothetical protein
VSCYSLRLPDPSRSCVPSFPVSPHLGLVSRHSLRLPDSSLCPSTTGALPIRVGLVSCHSLACAFPGRFCVLSLPPRSRVSLVSCHSQRPGPVLFSATLSTFSSRSFVLTLHAPSRVDLLFCPLMWIPGSAFCSAIPCTYVHNSAYRSGTPCAFPRRPCASCTSHAPSRVDLVYFLSLSFTPLMAYRRALLRALTGQRCNR